MGFFFCYPERSRSSAKGRQNGEEEEEVEDGARIVMPNLREEHTEAEPYIMAQYA